ncbi:chromosome segregation protein SMC [Oceanobacillus chungangensis]|uniref:Chromosome partition protein Smc n=1 Tax=Oceanobacillus chungangensis TaxID=1229152 RepID=A0A3D8PPI7_9BACI|nr:chromosome segregation protein SMC [Oceanobacillus chungangensis]RDW17864.1 chromosome segregation protein SMC [Oceanobacillus chungangensis]
MYLKRIESVGFKSFAERINVEFVPGVTAVVGPNGSGKSNIIDAIRWVLGEQSAKALRGTKMEDIIFQGSDTRKALNVAEVTLVLDNEDHTLPLDYDEVSVSRRVYRSGDSEFYINKQSCRLKDIIDLFMDSGLGREAFSIISQGKVEEILSSKPDERRTIFEEAAGVLKYKQRKKKAEYKLAETQENLNRVEDIIYEIEQQINPLKEQAETAKKYKELKEKLKHQEISFLIAEIEKLHNGWQTLLADIEDQKSKEQGLQLSIQQKESAIEQEKQRIQALDEEMEAQQSRLLATTEHLEKYEGRKQLLHERTKHFDENKQKLGIQKNETAVKIGTMHEELIREQKKLSDIQADRQKTKEAIKNLQAKLEISKETIFDQIEDLKSDYIELLNNQAAKRNEKQSIHSQLKQITGKKDKQADKFQDLLKVREELHEKKVETEAAYKVQNKEYLETAAEIKNLKFRLETARNSFQESQSKLYKGYQYIENLKSKKEMLDEMKEDFQGFFHGVKAVLKAREENQLEHIEGAVIELIDVPSKYITAIETVLGGQAQHIVVKDDQAARNAIMWLKRTNNGRATFLPLKSIQERFITMDMEQKVKLHQGYIGIAASLVNTNERYERAVNHLMGHVIIAESLKDANDIAKIVGRKYRVVTLEGDVVNPGGSMSGGAQKKTNQSLFTREKDIQEITEKLTAFQKKILLFEQKVQREKQEIVTSEEQLQQAEVTLSVKQQEIQELQATVREVTLKLESLNDNLSIYDQDKNQYMQDSNTLKTRDEQLTKELEVIANRLESIQKQIDDLSEQESKFKDNQEKLQNEYYQQQVILAEQDERVKNQREKARMAQNQLEDLQEQYDTMAVELTNLAEMEQSTETAEEIDQTIETSRLEKEEITASIQQKREERTKRTERNIGLETELKEENKKHQIFVQAIQEKEVKVNRLDVELENRLNHLQTEYTITYEKAKQMYEKAEDIEDAKQIVKELKFNIEQLGSVNLGAVDEYERISERYTFLSDQKNDLVEAKQTLYTVINEMDEEMEKRFDFTFNQIKDEFTVVFKQLFNGGHAELKLTDPKKLLDTGVDIVAQPPGKKLQNLSLLSGGERALTAIALLFAILRVRPVPFCILDEVEAALDEANVIRFAKYVKTYSEQTQFIVITHRQGTMEEADVLYGVTMQESGVSRLVSVRLEDTKELINL